MRGGDMRAPYAYLIEHSLRVFINFTNSKIKNACRFKEMRRFYP